VGKVDDSTLSNIKNLSRKVLGKIGSDSYRQKLVFDLLNAVKARDQSRFLWIILRAINAHSKDNPEDAKKLSSTLMKVFPSSDSEFEKVAYSIILGIIAGGGS